MKVPGLVEGILVFLANSDQAGKVPEWSLPNLRQLGVMGLGETESYAQSPGIPVPVLANTVPNK